MRQTSKGKIKKLIKTNFNRNVREEDSYKLKNDKKLQKSHYLTILERKYFNYCKDFNSSN